MYVLLRQHVSQHGSFSHYPAVVNIVFVKFVNSNLF